MNKDEISKGPVEVGQHPAMSGGAIVKPILFGSRARSLPACEGGHVVMKNEADAALIAEAFNVFAETGLTPRELANIIRAAADLIEDDNEREAMRTILLALPDDPALTPPPAKGE